MKRTAVAVMPRPGEYAAAVAEVLGALTASTVLSQAETIILKPNIVNDSPPPVTTDRRFVAAVADWISSRVTGRLVVAEGSASGSTLQNMESLGYREIGLPLVDLDDEPLVRVSHPCAKVLTEVLLPRLLLDAAVVSLPAAKEHTMTGVTLGLKNMVGCLPASVYGGYWTYKKSRIHKLGADRCIADLILYLEPDLTVIDASRCLLGGHLAGREPEPPPLRITASLDVIAADRSAARILGRRGDSIAHLVAAARLRERASAAGMSYNTAQAAAKRETIQGGSDATGDTR
jgi:uncharacterized protein (DUF362 family)